MERLSSYVTGLDLVANGGGFYALANPPVSVQGARPFAILAHIRIPLRAIETAAPPSHIIASCSDFTNNLGWAITWDRATQSLEVFRSTNFLAFQYTAPRGWGSASYSDVLVGLYGESGAATDQVFGNNALLASAGSSFVPAPAATLCIGGTDDAGLIGNYANPVGLAGGGAGDCMLSSFAVLATNVEPLVGNFVTQLDQVWNGILEQGSIPSDQPNLTHLFTARQGIPGLADNDNLPWVADVGGLTLTRTGVQTGGIVHAAQQRFLSLDV